MLSTGATDTAIDRYSEHSGNKQKKNYCMHIKIIIRHDFRKLAINDEVLMVMIFESLN
jgi:hypothetical protein